MLLFEVYVNFIFQRTVELFRAFKFTIPVLECSFIAVYGEKGVQLDMRSILDPSDGNEGAIRYAAEQFWLFLLK